MQCDSVYTYAYIIHYELSFYIHAYREMEATHANANIVFISHADTLQIAQTYMCGEDVRKFSQYRFKNGEVSIYYITNIYGNM